MIEKIRVSLWDIFTFFLTGMLVVGVAVGLGLAFGWVGTDVLVAKALALPVSILVIAGFILSTMLGMLLEPLANYSDSYVVGPIYSIFFKSKQKHLQEQIVLERHIAANYLGSLNGKIDKPYGICKEYVETKQLSTTFMVYLSRYGFYRNCAFIVLAALPIVLANLNGWCERFFGAVVCTLLIIVFKRRSEDFYSLMAPAVYRAFLIDKNSWAAGKGPE